MTMSITPERKAELMKEYATSENDTGSVEVQCAVLTERIKNLTDHLKENHKDFSSRRGLLMLVGRRRRLLSYVSNIDHRRYTTLITKLGIRK
jgi:small subunit ribosomal protein S15